MSKSHVFFSRMCSICIAICVPVLIAWSPTKTTISAENSAASAIVSLVEINPADLLLRRYRVAHENMIFESTSFALTGELQDTVGVGDFREKSLAAGFALQYYPQSISLQGLFIRGETDLALTNLRDESQSSDSTAATLRLAGDVGWRVRLSERLTGSAAYGLRTTVPQALWSSQPVMAGRWIQQKIDENDVRVQINLGLLL
jgi:hypothetical protein